MAGTRDLAGVAWLAAAVAPWAVAPHPNFTQESVSGPSLLALVSQLRTTELESYSSQLAASEPDWAPSLVEAAKLSVLDGTVAEGAGQLWNQVGDPQLSDGARVAAALFATVAQVELEEPELAIDRLQELAESLGSCMSPDLQPSRGAALIRRSLMLQLGIRKYECGDVAGAQTAIDVCQKIEAAGMSEEFQVSEGISWDSESVLADIDKACTEHELMLKSRLEGLDGDTWVELIRSRRSWPDQRIDADALARDRAYVNQAFDRNVGSGRKTVWSGGNPVLEKGWSSNLLAELSGNLYSIWETRLALGQLRVLLEPHDETAVAGAVRLLRLSGNNAALRGLLQSIQTQGPNEALRSSALTILERSSYPHKVSFADILVVSAAANFLNVEQLQLAIQGIFTFLEGGNPNRRNRQLDEAAKAWDAISRLLPESQLDSVTADRVLTELMSDRVDPFAESSLIAVVNAINWDSIEDSAKVSWRNWGLQHVNGTDMNNLAGLVIGLDPSLDIDEQLSSLDGMNVVLRLLNIDAGHKVADVVVERAKGVCLRALDEIHDEAGTGAISFGGYDAGSLSLQLALRFDLDELWDGVLRLVTAPAVDGSLKTKTLDGLTREFSRVPTEVKRSIRDNWENIAKSKFSLTFFGEEGMPRFAEAIRLGTLLGAVQRDEGVEAITELASHESSKSRIAACDSVPTVAGIFEDMEWGQIILLQLVKDHDPVVRSAAGSALAQVGGVQTTLTPMVQRNLLKLLDDDGIRIPLRVLHGLQVVAREGKWNYGQEFMFKIDEVAHSSSARVLRRAAIEILRILNQRFDVIDSVQNS